MTGESVESCVTGGPINPATFPVPDIHPGQLEYRAGRLRAKAADVSQAGSDIKSSWAGLSSCYSSPEAETLYAVVDPVATDGESVATGADKAATALEAFAEEVRGIKERWAALTADANAFLASVEGDDDWQKGGWFGGESEKVEEHNRLLARIDPLRRAYETAEIECANAINADLAVRTHFVHGGEGVDAGVHEYVHGYDEDLSGYDMPWGGPMDTDDRWYVDVAHSVGDFATGALEDLGAKAGMYSSEGWFEMSWDDAMWEYHEDNIRTLGAMAGVYDPENGTWGEVDWETFGNTWTEVAHAVVPWREWDERPGYVIGTAVLNIGSIVAGTVLTATGAGAVVGVPLLLWRGSAILDKVDLDLPRGMDGSSPNGIDVQLRLNLPYFGNVGAPLASFRLDLPGLGNSLNPSEMAELRDALSRLEQANDGDTAVPDLPDDPTTRGLDDGLIVEDVLNPASAEATRLREKYEGDFLENDVRGDGAPDSWEASETGGGSNNGDHDGSDENRVPALVGPRSDPGESAGTPDPSPDRPVDLTGNGDGSLDIAGGDSRVPVVSNSVDNGHAADTPAHDDRGFTHHGNDGGIPSDGGGGGIRPGDGYGPDHGDTRPGSAGGDLTSDRSENGPDTPLTDQPAIRHDSTDPEIQRLVPGRGRRFGDGVDLEPNSRYTLYADDNKRHTEYITDADSNIREIRVDSEGWGSRHPEFMDPRPDMTYNVDGYVYRTDGLSRTVSVEGTLREGKNARNDNEQKIVNNQGSLYYEELNKYNQEKLGSEAPQYREIDWNGGHLIGSSEFFGIGERLNQVPMRFDVNRTQPFKALDKLSVEQRRSLGGSFRNIERTWSGLMRKGERWHGFHNSRFNDGTWSEALKSGPEKPEEPKKTKIDVKITNIYDPQMPVLSHPSKSNKKILPPPSMIEVQWSINGTAMKTQTYNNVPPRAN
ncbi:DNA/RNA non-specific endonuclease [Nocardiopsis deserti]|uniref:DNA/RNA non-specific endonuclease n=1 Tax=Nocardiopsis deserti TaxID=2605988 RepID=UPI001239D8A0|nr:DNA/RNA non-specific endonuclease [Nocardiopsis deserti]